MRKRLFGTVALAAVALVLLPMSAGCTGDDAVPVESGGVGDAAAQVDASSEDIAALVDGGNQFAFDLYARLAGDGNLFFSPYSISTALAMTAAGARGNTEREMATVLHFPTEDVAGKASFMDRERVVAEFADRLLLAKRQTSTARLRHRIGDKPPGESGRI